MSSSEVNPEPGEDQREASTDYSKYGIKDVTKYTTTTALGKVSFVVILYRPDRLTSILEIE